jgi:hypothetical protein|uniref:Uncharacterized protein n=1 Tax=viral metagenome TaxID=1070528 RepID=A0A6C0IYR3_9ZZZZ
MSGLQLYCAVVSRFSSNELKNILSKDVGMFIRPEHSIYTKQTKVIARLKLLSEVIQTGVITDHFIRDNDLVFQLHLTAPDGTHAIDCIRIQITQDEHKKINYIRISNANPDTFDGK